MFLLLLLISDKLIENFINIKINDYFMSNHFKDSKLVELAESGNAVGYYDACNHLNVTPDPMFEHIYELGAAEKIDQIVDDELRFANYVLSRSKQYSSKKQFLQDTFPKFNETQDITNYSDEKIFGLYNGIIESYKKIINSPRSELIKKNQKVFL